jgi:hypothetical protein
LLWLQFFSIVVDALAPAVDVAFPVVVGFVVVVVVVGSVVATLLCCL